MMNVYDDGIVYMVMFARTEGNYNRVGLKPMQKYCEYATELFPYIPTFYCCFQKRTFLCEKTYIFGAYANIYIW